MTMFEGGRQELIGENDSSDHESDNDEKPYDDARKTVEDSESLGVIDSEQPASTERAPQRPKKQYAVSTRWERELAEGRDEEEFLNKVFCCCARRVGNMYFLIEKQDGSPVVVAGPCWPFCMGVTVPLIVGISAAVIFLVIFNQRVGFPTWVAGIYLPIVFFTLGALFCVSCRDPGLMERVTDEEAGEGGWYWNEQVGSYRPPGALYCRECGVLVQDYDHLCPWTGTGIGHKNMISFKIFVVSVNVLCYSSVILVAVGLLHGLLQ